VFPARIISFFVALCFAVSSLAVHLKIHGEVTGKHNAQPLGNVTVKVYDGGELVSTQTTNSKGKYEVSFANQGRYTIRFSYPGYASKCFSVNTRGPSWEGDHSKQKLYIGMTMVKRLEGFDLSLLDMPMGKARFDPATGFVRWDKVWHERISPKYKALMNAYDRRIRELKEEKKDPHLASFPAPRF